MKRIGLKHLSYLTDDFSIWQHTNGPKIDEGHGYSLDDGARALLVALKIKDYGKAKIYIDFLEKAIGNGKFVLFYDKDRRPLYKPVSEDALGEAYWALAECVDNKFEPAQAKRIIKSITPRVKTFIEPRGVAYALLGSVLIDEKMAISFAEFLVKKYKSNSSKNWKWLENDICYSNAIIPLALVSAGDKFQKKLFRETGLRMLDFLNTVSKDKNIPITIGNKGWYLKGKKKAVFDQQPIDAAYQVLANLRAWESTSLPKYMNEAKKYFSWFWGNNLVGKPLINTRRESCYDGLHSGGTSKNCGSESIVCYLLAQEEIWPFLTSK